MKNFLNKICSIKNDDKFHKIITICGIKLKIKMAQKELKAKYNVLQQKVVILEKYINKIVPRTTLKGVETHIVEHCNLNCAGCGHYSNIADEEYLDINEFIKDYSQLAKITKGNLERIDLLGGEPLLHPQCIDFCIAARNLFPNSEINLVTNGILLNKMEDEFYKKLAEYNVVIKPTLYPIKIDWESVKSRCEKYNVKFDFYDLTLQSEDPNLKMFTKNVLDLDGKCDAREKWLHCYLDNTMLYFEHGKLYACWQMPYIKHFNKKFNKNLEVTCNDYVDVYKVENIYEVMKFMSKPFDFCRYCADIGNIEKLQPWRVTKKEITEWTNVYNPCGSRERERE